MCWTPCFSSRFSQTSFVTTQPLGESKTFLGVFFAKVDSTRFNHINSWCWSFSARHLVDCTAVAVLARQWHRAVLRVIGSEPWRFCRSARPYASDLKLWLGSEEWAVQNKHIFAMWQSIQSCDPAIPLNWSCRLADLFRFRDDSWHLIDVEWCNDVMMFFECFFWSLDEISWNRGDLQCRHQLLPRALALGHPSLLGDEGGSVHRFVHRFSWDSSDISWGPAKDGRCFTIFYQQYLHQQQLSATIQWFGGKSTA